MASEEEAGAPEQERQEGGEGGVQGERPAEKKVNYYEVLGVDQDADGELPHSPHTNDLEVTVAIAIAAAVAVSVSLTPSR
eukprot:1765641-Rhodomonas_salina.4